MMYYWQDGATEMGADAGWESQLDAFFLRGQQAGAFRIDISAPALTELWAAIFTGLVDAERRGRIARASLLSLVEQSFLQGAAVE
jgi:TetR/AcrR family transcriptional repressor of mexCD-oprJ operon